MKQKLTALQIKANQHNLFSVLTNVIKWKTKSFRTAGFVEDVGFRYFPNIMTRVIYQETDFLSCYDWFPLGNGPSDAWKFTEFCTHDWSLFRHQLAFSADGGPTPKNMCK